MPSSDFWILPAVAGKTSTIIEILFCFLWYKKKKVKIKSTLCFSKIGSTRDSVNILHFKTSTISCGPLFGTAAELLLRARIWPQWVILCWYCCVGLQAPSLPLWSFPFAPLQGKILGLWVGPPVKSGVQETCTSQKNIVEGWASGVLLCSFLSTSCWYVSSVTVCIKSSALLSAAINAASTDKSNKYLCASWMVLVYFLVLFFLS